MILLWFILGIVLIFLIARYNESNKLFWTLLFAFVMGFAGTKMVLQTINGEEQSEVCFNQNGSTQVSITTLNALQHFITDVKLTNSNVVTALKPASQGLICVNKTNFILSEVNGGIRDQPLDNPIKPPEQCLVKNISIPLDYG